MRLTKEDLLRKAIEVGVKSIFGYQGDVFALKYYQDLLIEKMRSRTVELMYQANSDTKILSVNFGLTELELSPSLEDDEHMEVYRALNEREKNVSNNPFDFFPQIKGDDIRKFGSTNRAVIELQRLYNISQYTALILVNFTYKRYSSYVKFRYMDGELETCH